MSNAIAAWHGAFGRATLYRLNRPIKPHAHREGHLIFHLDGPLAWSRSPRGAALLAGHRCASINPWEPHEFIPGDRHEGSHYLVLYVSPEWFAAFGQGRDVPLRFGRCEIDPSPRATVLVEALRLALPRAGGTTCVDTAIFELTAEAYRLSWQGMPIAAFGIAAKSDYRIRRASQLIRDRLGTDIQLDDIAREAGLSRPHFYKLFRDQIGVTPHLYLDTLRMERAIERLTGTAETVIDIGLSLGFESHSGFSRFFADHVGVSPTEYRRAATGGTGAAPSGAERPLRQTLLGA